MENRTIKFAHDLNKLNNDTTKEWVFNWLSDLVRADNQTSNTHLITLGLRKTSQLLRMRNDFFLLDEFQKLCISQAYNKAKNRLILLDNEVI